MRGVGLALLLALPALSGCLSFLDDEDEAPAVRPADVGHDPAAIRVTQVVKHTATVPSFDGTALEVLAYEPTSADLTAAGASPTWGTVLFLHGWGQFKETFEGAGGATGTPAPEDGQVENSVNFLRRFAENGLIAVAYDARGFGRSEGTSTIAGAAELADLEEVRRWAERTFPTNGHFGVIGESYGGGQAYQALVDNPAITTVVPMFGWVDLYDGLLPGNVPKAHWAALLGGLGVGGSAGRPSPLLADWYQKALSRTDLHELRAQMDARSAAGRLAGVTKPLFTCQGLQETLFPQVDRAAQEAGGFTRAYVYTGGHSVEDEGCWSRALQWCRYFLGGHETGVAGWPALETVDASGGRAVAYTPYPASARRTYYLDAPNLEQGFPSNATFTIQQRLLSNPFQEPAVLSDALGPGSQVPEDFRQDPNAVAFDTAPFPGSEVLLGAPTLRLELQRPDGPVPFQVTGQLLHVNAAGQARILSRAAYAALDAGDVENGSIELRFDWVKADLSPGDRIVLKLAANDLSWFLPLQQNYSVTFTGRSELRLPFFEG